jgi:hypothetical protein
MQYDAIILENGPMYLTQTELNNLKRTLKESNITLQTFSNDTPKDALNDISVYICAHITELFIAGLLIPAAYDILKSSLKFIIFRIKEKVKIIQAGKVREAQPCIQFQICNGEIIALIPKNLSENQFDKYMDELLQAVRSVKTDSRKKYVSFIIKQNEVTLEIEAKTMQQYAQEQYAKQEFRRSNNGDL